MHFQCVCHSNNKYRIGAPFGEKINCIYIADIRYNNMWQILTQGLGCDRKVGNDGVWKYAGYVQAGSSPSFEGLWELSDGRREKQKYDHKVYAWLEILLCFLQGEAVTKESLVCWKEKLTQGYLPASVNSMLAAVNGFLEWAGYPQYRVKPLKIQREIFTKPERSCRRRIHPSGKGGRGKAELPSGPYSADNLRHWHPCFGT